MGGKIKAFRDGDRDRERESFEKEKERKKVELIHTSYLELYGGRMRESIGTGTRMCTTTRQEASPLQGAPGFRILE